MRQLVSNGSTPAPRARRSPLARHQPRQRASDDFPRRTGSQTFSRPACGCGRAVRLEASRLRVDGQSLPPAARDAGSQSLAWDAPHQRDPLAEIQSATRSGGTPVAGSVRCDSHREGATFAGACPICRAQSGPCGVGSRSRRVALEQLPRDRRPWSSTGLARHGVDHFSVRKRCRGALRLSGVCELWHRSTGSAVEEHCWPAFPRRRGLQEAHARAVGDGPGELRGPPCAASSDPAEPLRRRPGGCEGAGSRRSGNPEAKAVAVATRRGLHRP